ncbi:MAG: excinuclease ABC subunit UvrA [Bacteroidales bacterium]|nr:excinuclease ABC subunit UvrA [Bacteroidales bacterium]
MSEKKIIIQGAKVNNLKNVSVEIPQGKLVVVTGLSGSGKSSLAFDTLYAEGQRRYVESLSSYARQFMGKISKPDVERIRNIPPAIAIEQRVISRNPRSTVGTTTEIYEYLKLLYARVGHIYSPVSHKEVRRETVADVLAYLATLADDVKVYLLSPVVVLTGRTLSEQLIVLQKEGYSRVVYDKELMDINDFLSIKRPKKSAGPYLLVDRFKAATLKDAHARVASSVESAFNEGKGCCIVQTDNGGEVRQKAFNDVLAMDGITFLEPSPNLFSFNNPYGACPICGGTGMVEDIAPELVIPNPELSLFEGAVACWHGDKLQEWKDQFVKYSVKHGFPPHRAIEDLSPEEYDLLWNGREEWHVYGIRQFFMWVEAQRYKIQYRVLYSRYRGRTECHDCHGLRLRKEAGYVLVNGKSINDLVSMPVAELYDFVQRLKFSNRNEEKVARHIVTELRNRLGFMMNVGLGYLTLNRPARTLSGGESQRINLAASLGSSLVGSLYILDEPSIGLHQRDTQQLIQVLRQLRDIGNTVVVVEHDEEIIRAADYLIDMGPEAGRLGGEVVFAGNYDELVAKSDGLTAAYLRGMMPKAKGTTLQIPVPKYRRSWRNYIEIIGAKEHNLKNIDVKIPLEILTVVTGVSGSGKSTLIKDILYPGISKKIEESSVHVGRHKSINADMSRISEVVIVDQNPIGRSSRSNPALYIKAYDDIRELYAAQPLSKQRNYKPGYFSFNSPGGRCEECEGEGVIHVGMQFMADVDIECSECHGKHFKDEVLEVKVGGKDINDILEMTINQAVEFFDSIQSQHKIIPGIVDKLRFLQNVGLGYLKMGQPSQTLSGGESQRVKLALYLSQGRSKQNVLFIFDEPTTGLHFHDINKLYSAFNQLIERGNSVIVIEHNLEIIKCADWIVDLGPEGGDQGGRVVCEGTPEQVAACLESHTGQALKEKGLIPTKK